MKARIVFSDESTHIVDIITKTDGDVTVATLPELDYTKINYIDFGYDYFNAGNDEDGYLVYHQVLYQFGSRVDREHCHRNNELPIYGVKRGEEAMVAIVTGMPHDFDICYGTKSGTNYIYARFNIDGETPYEDICVQYHALHGADANYSGMGRRYRKYLLDTGFITPIKDRMNPVLEYTKDSAYIRLRLAWKPVPTPVEEQTVENEPPMHVAMTFKRVEELIDELKKQGVDKAELCLVGWNKSGHDGRWPNPFPVEPKLGGEDDLRHLIQYAQENGYQITCHTNSEDSYSISDMHDEKNNSLYLKDGTPRLGGAWGGGRSRTICPVPALRQAKELLPKIADLGFRGAHYIDVMGIVNAKSCYHPDHPLTKKGYVEVYHDIADVAIEQFGGYSSEGGYHFMCKKLDYALYTTFADPFMDVSRFADDESIHYSRLIPLWEIVFHGTVLSNPFTCSVNAAIKGKRSQLKSIEFGSRPTIYYYSAFVTPDENGGGNWMGSQDITCDDQEDLEKSVACVKQVYDEYKERRYLQTEFMENHEEIAPGVYEITYSDGSKMVVDYNEETYKLIKA